MVLKGVVGGIINRVPLSGYVVPTRVQNYLSEQQHSDSDIESESDIEGPLRLNEEHITPKEMIHNQILRNRTKDKISSELTLYEIDSTIEEIYNDKPLQDPLLDVRVKQYLNDQNDKFNQLINNNLDVVLNQQKYPEDIKVNIPEQSFIKSFVADSTSKIFSRVVKSYYPDTKLEDGSIPMDKLLDNDIKMDIFIDSLDTPIKIKLLQELSQDLAKKEFLDLHEFKDHVNAPVENQILMDKIQDFLIISIKFIVVCLKLSIPLMKYLYIKFANNELVLFNEKNLNKFFNFILKLMKIMEKNLKKNDDLINKYYQNEKLVPSSNHLLNEPDFQELYQELSRETQNFVSRQVFENNNATPTTSPTWKRTAFEFLMDKYVKSQYPQTQTQTQTSSAQPQTPPYVVNPNRGYMNDARYSMYFDKSPKSNASNGSAEDLGLMEMAEQFAEEL